MIAGGYTHQAGRIGELITSKEGVSVSLGEEYGFGRLSDRRSKKLAIDQGGSDQLMVVRQEASGGGAINL